MKQHKWHKEIKAWADGAEIERIWVSDDYDNPEHWVKVDNPEWDDDSKEFRIKPQPKEPQYLYVYFGKLESGKMGVFFERQEVPYISKGLIGKIKLEVEDE